MGEEEEMKEQQQIIHHHHNRQYNNPIINAKLDVCLDLSLRRVFYSSFAGAFCGLLLFRSPATRWATVAFGAGVGIGSAYTECSHILEGSIPKVDT